MSSRGLPLPACGERSVAGGDRVRGIHRKQFAQYGLQNAFGVLKHIVVPEAEHAIVLLAKPLVARPVMLIHHMLPAINFDDDPPVSAYEVDDIPSDRLLPDEFEPAQLAGTQSVPQQQFGARRVVTQPPRTQGSTSVRTAHRLTPSPGTRKCARADLSPQAGRGETRGSLASIRHS